MDEYKEMKRGMYTEKDTVRKEKNNEYKEITEKMWNGKRKYEKRKRIKEIEQKLKNKQTRNKKIREIKEKATIDLSLKATFTKINEWMNEPIGNTNSN